jgi:23S rRNA (cytidine1920-2'-O)/16S rRNA (cytidine1409-2'-O)-methyltransferase
VSVRRRLDVELVRRGLAPSRAAAQTAIAEHLVTVGGAIAGKPSHLVAPGDPVELIAPARFVGRGGLKLDGALEHFALDVAGARCLDAGASTGGFTDCLLQRGAAEVVAVDVGHGQLHPSIRDDARVVVMERCNVRHLTPDLLGGVVDVVVADLSFISLATVLPALLGMCRPAAELVLLVKPQFEAGRAEVAKGHGVVRDPAVREAVRDGIDDALRQAGASIMGWMESPIRGADGNVELFVHARTSGGSERA